MDAVDEGLVKRLRILDPPLEGLTPYDQYRDPITQLPSEEVVTVSVKEINPLLTCAVCLSCMQKPMAVMECMHRFCDDCISRTLRLDKKQCPTCRRECKTRRSLRADSEMSALLAMLYPSREDFDALQVDIDLSELPAFQEPVPNPGRRGRRPALSPGASPSPPEGSSGSAGDASGSASASPAGRGGDSGGSLSPPDGSDLSGDDMGGRGRSNAAAHMSLAAKRRLATRMRLVDFLLVAHPNSRLTGLDKPYVRTIGACTISQLCKFIASKMPGVDPRDIQLLTDTETGETTLDSDVTIGHVSRVFWGDQIMRSMLYFKRRK